MYSKFDIFFSVLFSIAIAATIIVCCVAFHTSVVEHNKKSSIFNIKETIDIKSLETENAMSGSFFLGRGKIKEKPKYYAYTIIDDGGYKLYEFDADKTTLYETLEDGEQAYAEIYINETETDYRYKLYIPKGTIITQYDAMVTK